MENIRPREHQAWREYQAGPGEQQPGEKGLARMWREYQTRITGLEKIFDEETSDLEENIRPGANGVLRRKAWRESGGGLRLEKKGCEKKEHRPLRISGPEEIRRRISGLERISGWKFRPEEKLSGLESIADLKEY
jgi:hypothetical protein